MFRKCRARPAKANWWTLRAIYHAAALIPSETARATYETGRWDKMRRYPAELARILGTGDPIPCLSRRRVIYTTNAIGNFLHPHGISGITRPL